MAQPGQKPETGATERIQSLPPTLKLTRTGLLASASTAAAAGPGEPANLVVVLTARPVAGSRSV